MKHIEQWKTLGRQTILDHHRFQLVRHICELPNGKILDDYYVLEENDIGIVFALTADHQVVLVEQYKHGAGKVTLELPAGLFDSAVADPETEARREFNEETGYDAEKFLFLAKLGNNPTRMNSYFHLFIAFDAHPIGQQNLDQNEFILVRLFPLAEVFQLIRDSKIDGATTIAAIYLAVDHLTRSGILC